MFEELLNRKKQTKSQAHRSEADAIQKISSKRQKHGKSTSMSVASYLWLMRFVVGSILLIGLVIVGAFAYGLVEDFLIYSSGETHPPSHSMTMAEEKAKGE